MPDGRSVCGHCFELNDPEYGPCSCEEEQALPNCLCGRGRPIVSWKTGQCLACIREERTHRNVRKILEKAKRACSGYGWRIWYLGRCALVRYEGGWKFENHDTGALTPVDRQTARIILRGLLAEKWKRCGVPGR